MSTGSSLRSRLVIFVATLALALGGCALPAPMLQQVGGAPKPPQAEPLKEFYEQDFSWTSCGRDFECGAVTVPIDYENPGSGTIDIALKKYGLDGASGMVLVNPGGPGGSGVEMVEYAPYVFPHALREARELVGFDPRGVAGSAPISCYDDAQLDEFYTETFDVETRAGWEELIASVRDYYATCEERNPQTLAFVDTVSAARDMDIIRAVLGIDRLDYIGFSYGTKLGATYADLFGTSVGRFILDGAMDVSLGLEELNHGQVSGFEHGYRAYLKDCLTGPGCPFAGTVDNAYDDTVLLLDELSRRPAPTSDASRPATDDDLLNAIILALYNTDNWPMLTVALAALRSGDGDKVKILSDLALERDEDGHYPPGDGAMNAVHCLDLPVHDMPEREALLAVSKEYEEISSLFGEAMGFGTLGCALFPVKTDFGPREITAPDAPTMVVIGTTGDPATPYEWSVAMASQLDDAVLLTREGEGHTAYGKGSCIDDAVNAFLLEGILPDDGLRC